MHTGTPNVAGGPIGRTSTLIMLVDASWRRGTIQFRAKMNEELRKLEIVSEARKRHKKLNRVLQEQGLGSEVCKGSMDVVISQSSISVLNGGAKGNASLQSKCTVHLKAS